MQVQHIGTQLCWQVFVDDPGMPLGIGVLVHAAAPDELVSSPPPEAPPELEAKKEQMVVNFAFEPLDDEARDDGEDEEYKNGVDVNEDGTGEASATRRRSLRNRRPTATRCSAATVLSHAGTNPEEDQPLKVATECAPTGAEEFELTLNYVNFNDQPSINFTIELLWKPPDESADTQAGVRGGQEEVQRGDGQGRASRVRQRGA